MRRIGKISRFSVDIYDEKNEIQKKIPEADVIITVGQVESSDENYVIVHK